MKFYDVNLTLRACLNTYNIIYLFCVRLSVLMATAAASNYHAYKFIELEIMCSA